MKRFATVFGMFVALVCAAVDTLSAQWLPERGRNNIMWRPIDWQKFEWVVEIPNGVHRSGCAVELHFPRGMENHVARERVRLTETIQEYASLFERLVPIFKPAPDDDEFELDELDRVRVRFGRWHPKRIVFIWYPNPQDFNQQRVIPEFIPPDVGGFTELSENRFVYPYSGDANLFAMVGDHELAHVWMLEFIRSEKQFARADKERDLKDPPPLPLWCVEGYAEVMATHASKQSGHSAYRRAKTEEVNRTLALNEKLPPLEESFGFLSYTMGFSFLEFASRQHGMRSFQHVFARNARGDDIEKAWRAVYRRDLREEEIWWRTNRRFVYFSDAILANADPATAATLEPLRGTVFRCVGPVAYDDQSGYFVWYAPDQKWKVNVSVINFRTGATGEVTHMFEGLSLFFRINNPPALWRDTVAVVTSRRGRDVIERYKLQETEGILSAEKFSETEFSGLIWVNDIEFISRDSILFVGMDERGRSDIHTYSFSSRRLVRLTDDANAKRDPAVFRGRIAYIEGGGEYDQQLCLTDGSTYERISFGEDQSGVFVDQLVGTDSLLSLKVLNRDGTSRIILWDGDTTRAYQYVHGTLLDQGRGRVAYPMPSQLVAVTRGRRLVITTSMSPLFERHRVYALDLEWNRLRTMPVRIERSRTGNIPLASTDVEVTAAPADQSLRFSSIADYSTVAFTNATGEYGIAMNAFGFSYNRDYGWLYRLSLSYFDLSERLERSLGLDVGRYFALRSPFFLVRDEDISIDHAASLSYGLRYPIDLEKSVGVFAGGGYLHRRYPISKRDGFSSGIYRIGAYFESKGAFVDLLQASRHGHLLSLSLQGTVAHENGRDRFLDGQAFMDFRYYLRPLKVAPYLATQLLLGTSFGSDPYSFFSMDMFVRSGFWNLDRARSVGTRMAIYKTEFRFPLARLVIFDHQFWFAKQPIFFLSANTGLFLYGGSIARSNKPIKLSHRTGWFIEWSPWVLPIYLRFEMFHYIGESRKILPAWSFFFEW